MTSLPASPCSILVVEDDWSLRDPLVELLAEEGYSVVGAANGAEALGYIHRNHPPGLILLDLMMPGMNGWEFHNLLQRDPKLANIPVIVISAVAEFQRGRAQREVAGLLSKPLDVKKLLTLVQQYCR